MMTGIQPKKVIVIGGGFTGIAIGYDLAQRGYQVHVLERGELVSGTSGRTHGLLHSGARYCVNDQESAVECIEENITLRKIAGQCIEPNGGFFIGLNDEDVAYSKLFVEGAEKCGIETKEMRIADLLRLEPEINPATRVAYSVPDGTFDPLRLAFAFAASAKKYGAQFHPYHEVQGFIVDNSNRVTGVQVWDRASDRKLVLDADLVINAAGSWAGIIAGYAGINVPVKPTPGVMVAVEKRLTNTTINRMSMPGDGDIILPQRRMVVIGTTSFSIEDVDYIPIYRDQVQMMVDLGSEMIPAIRNTGFRGIYMSSRPLISAGTEARSLARTFKCYDHESGDGVAGMISIIGGKATTCRVMAEKTADLVDSKFGLSNVCRTKELPLESFRKYYGN